MLGEASSRLVCGKTGGGVTLKLCNHLVGL
jgi:hypothetical protein